MRHASRTAGVVSSCLALAFTAGVAEAAPDAPRHHSPAQSSSQFTMHREEAGGADGTAARARARAGDCAGALPLFDSAIRNTIEPTLRRDRGLCHEKVGHVFPAIDDYRAYLQGRADAPDADQIRDRLAKLEEQAGVGGSSAPAAKDDDSKSGGEAGASVSVGSGGASAKAGASSYAPPKRDKQAVLGPKAGEADRSYDYYAAQERELDAADASALRYGTGPVLGAYVMIPRYAFGRGGTSEMGYSIGGTLRYSTSPTITLMSEIGFAAYGKSGDATTVSGPLLFAGVELRLPISKMASDQIVLGGGGGYEHYTVAGSKAATNLLLGRFRLGFRHVFGPQFGFELFADGGPAYETEGGETLGVIGGSFAFVVAF
mgnify:CR=1 FL=1